MNIDQITSNVEHFLTSHLETWKALGAFLAVVATMAGMFFGIAKWWRGRQDALQSRRDAKRFAPIAEELEGLEFSSDGLRATVSRIANGEKDPTSFAVIPSQLEQTREINDIQQRLEGRVPEVRQHFGPEVGGPFGHLVFSVKNDIRQKLESLSSMDPSSKGAQELASSILGEIDAYNARLWVLSGTIIKAKQNT
jgi:hypothetical protein